ncbi:HEPN domain-containing protein [Mesorhizobium sp. RMAD-H1]|uniref:HEPN domain-containing protein n=1 Tax=Mesorhizobium sp. RMAD-H1 TaxID=2587065 RepID=UPI00161A08D9|nr:HEPN domain-containing protein [Mesorhizobium sp. RMAD-H1]MBB2973109.1 HEPN domain-containing protein [Mesorhizobium sp. RMAD-H1]
MKSPLGEPDDGPPPYASPEAAVSVTLPERLGDLPEHRRRELERIARILFDEFEEAQKGRLADKEKDGRILKLVLFGSCVHGYRVEAWQGDGRCEYNLLVVVSTKTFADPRFWDRATDRLQRELAVTKSLAMPVNFIVHSIMDLNNQLVQGRPFFVDVARDGLILHDTPGFPFVKPRPLDLEVARAEMRRHFDYWFPSATHRFELAKEAMGRGYNREAAFDLHQTVERLYHGTLRVLTLHSPKSHRLAWLRTHAERVAPRLIAVWPRDNRFAEQCFARLDRAYVEARYLHRYEITDEELAWLVGRVRVLQETAAAICAARLDGIDCAAVKTEPRHDHQDA